MHLRMPPTTLLPLSRLEADPNDVYSDQIVNLYVQLDEGKINLSLTRIKSSMINMGCYTRKSNGVIDHTSNLRPDYIPFIIEKIRNGSRPSVDLFWCVHIPSGPGYICPDDEVTLAAYRQLGIRYIPCRVIRPIDQQLEEGSIWVNGAVKSIPTMKKAIPARITGIPSFFGSKNPDARNAFRILRRHCEDTLRAIENFHIVSDSEIHYHYMLHAFVRRHIRSINHIEYLSNAGGIEHACVILRMAYEAFLNLYIDWLAPQFLGPRLQLHSILKNQPNVSVDKSNSVLGNFPDLFDNVSQKARISPFGADLHAQFYSQVSSIAHQSYINLEYDASSFQDKDKPQFKLSFLIRWLDLITATSLIKIQNDVGHCRHEA